MYAHFGQKWIKLLRGPMWYTVLSTQEEASTNASRTQKTMEVHIDFLADCIDYVCTFIEGII